MISQDDKKIRLENKRLNEAFKFIKEKINCSNEEIQHLSIEIKLLEESKGELQKVLQGLQSVSEYGNDDLFSPSLYNNKKNQVEDFSLKYNKVEENLRHINLKLSSVENENNNFINLLQCLEELEMNYNFQSNMSSTCNFYGINLLEAQENERKRISRDLHDSTVQSLTSLKHKTELITRLIDMDPIRAKLESQTMIHTLKTTIDEMRGIIYNLRPMSLDDLGLIVTVERYINDVKKNYGINIIFNCTNKEYSVSPVINLTIYRIIQESINNVIKHANASKVIVNLSYNSNEIVVSIIDDGIGFNPNELKTPNNQGEELSGFGLSIMKERIFLLKGKFNIISNESNGTEISVSVPINQSEHTRRI